MEKTDPKAVDRIRSALTPRLNDYIPHTPHPRQAAFLLLPHREVLFGGSAGGGKSDAMLMAACQYADVPGYSAAIFRRTYKQLTGADGLIERSHDWLSGTDAQWRESEKAWKFPSGAVLEFHHMQHEKDRFQHQGHAYHFVGFDELTHFTEKQYTYMFSRQRRTADDLREASRVPIRIRSTANPGGVGHDWVARRFGLLDDDPTPGGRIFIPSMLEDNPSLDQEDYEKSLAELDPITYEQLRRGNWKIRPGGHMFSSESIEVVLDHPDGSNICRYWDMAATTEEERSDPDWTAGALMMEHDGIWYLLDMKRARVDDAGIEDLLRQTAILDRQRFGNIDILLEQEPGSSGKNYTKGLCRNVLRGYSAQPRLPTGSKVARARPLSAAASKRNRNFKVVSGPWVSDFLAELDAFPLGGHDDQVDAASGAMEWLNTMYSVGERERQDTGIKAQPPSPMVPDAW